MTSFVDAGIKAPPEVYVSTLSLRTRFAQGQYIERADQGEFSCCLVQRGLVKAEGDLRGFRSYVVGYLEIGTSVRAFTVHFYMNDSGTIGASGLPDPKWLHEDGIVSTSNRRRGSADVA